MLGTAPVVDAWIILTHRGTWRPKALADNDLPAPVRQWLDAQVAALQAQGLAVRPQFARQSGGGATRAGATLFVARGGELRRLDAADAQALLGLDLTSEAVLEGFERVAAPNYFVCTNGQRDVCCARLGLPVYARLRERVDSRAWQTTHVGGHRFAANVLVLPQGVLYGRLDPGSVAGFLAAVEAGRVATPHLRGRSAWPPEAQAAEALCDAPALAVLECGGGRVVLRTQRGVLRAAVTAEPTRGILASCGEVAGKDVVAYSARPLAAD